MDVDDEPHSSPRGGVLRARDLKAVLDAIVGHLEATHDLPHAVPEPEAPTSVPNPFG